MKVVKLTQSDIEKMVKKAIKENFDDFDTQVQPEELKAPEEDLTPDEIGDDNIDTLVSKDASEVKNDPNGLQLTMGEDENFIYIFGKTKDIPKAKLIAKTKK